MSFRIIPYGLLCAAALGAMSPAATIAADGCAIGPFHLVRLPLTPVAVHARGVVLGTTATHRAALWSAPGGLRELPLPAGFARSEAVAINERGIAVAIARDPATGRFQAYAVEQGRVVLLAGEAARPFHIDDAGTVAGEAVLTGQARSEPVLWRLSKRTTGHEALSIAPEPLGACCGGTAKVLDGRGDVAGDFYDQAGHYHAFRWRADSGLGRILLQDRFSSAVAMNRQGDVLIVTFPQIWLATASGLTRIALGSKRPAQPRALNDCGVIVGDVGPFADAARAFAWNRTQGFQDLNTWIPKASGWTLESAVDIDEQGDIVGRGDAPDALDQGFLLEHPRSAQVTGPPASTSRRSP